MNFEYKFAELVQKYPKLAADENMKVTFTLKQFRQVCRWFFDAGTASKKVPSLFEAIFGSTPKF